MTSDRSSKGPRGIAIATRGFTRMGCGPLLLCLSCAAPLLGCQGRKFEGRSDALIAEQAASARNISEPAQDRLASAASGAAGASEQRIERKSVAAVAKPDMQRVLDALKALNGKPITELSAEEARKQPTPADAVRSLLQKQGGATPHVNAVNAGNPGKLAKVENRKVPVAGGQLNARVYTPERTKLEARLRRRLPVIAFWHGGGFVLGGLDAYDASARALAQQAHAIVVAFEYRRGPEHRFPAAHDDAIEEYAWVVQNAASLGGNPKHLAVAGESAGANLAFNVAVAARDRGMVRPKHQLLIYPVAANDLESESYQEWAEAQPLNKAMMQWFFANYLNNPKEAEDPRLNLLAAPLEGLPSTTLILAEIDPLHTEGGLLARKLLAANVDDVQVRTSMGVTHEFFGMGAVVAEAAAAQTYAGERLRDALK